jgi:hypothetical protein
MHWARAHVDPLVALRTVACADRWTEVWPLITTRLRADVQKRRRTRRQAHRQPPPTSTPVELTTPPAVVTAAGPSSRLTPPSRRAKSIVNGRPSALHPWKRYGFGRLSHDRRDLRFPADHVRKSQPPTHLAPGPRTKICRRRLSATSSDRLGGEVCCDRRWLPVTSHEEYLMTLPAQLTSLIGLGWELDELPGC